MFPRVLLPVRGRTSLSRFRQGSVDIRLLTNQVVGYIELDMWVLS